MHTNLYPCHAVVVATIHTESTLYVAHYYKSILYYTFHFDNRMSISAKSSLFIEIVRGIGLPRARMRMSAAAIVCVFYLSTTS